METRSRETTLAAACMHVVHDKKKNTAKYVEFIEEAANQKVDLLVFPEVSLQGYLRKMSEVDYASRKDQIHYYLSEGEKVPGPTTELICEYAKKHNMYIQFGLAEINQAETAVYNSAVLIGPEGIIGIFRKVHANGESPPFRPGIAFKAFDTALGRVGPLICADLCYPESIRILAVQGAIIGTMSTAYPMVEDGDPLEDYNAYLYRTYANAQAAMSQLWLVQSNHIGRSDAKGASHYFGNSRIVSPWGKVVAECGYQETLVTATVDLWGEIYKVRSWDRNLADRRPELYGILTKQDGSYGPF